MTRETAWTADLRQPGAEGPIVLRDPGDGPEGRVVCLIPGHLVHHQHEGEVRRLLDEDDVAHARLILAASRLLAALQMARTTLPDGVPREVMDAIDAALTEAAGRR